MHELNIQFQYRPGAPTNKNHIIHYFLSQSSISQHLVRKTAKQYIMLFIYVFKSIFVSLLQLLYNKFSIAIIKVINNKNQ